MSKRCRRKGKQCTGSTLFFAQTCLSKNLRSLRLLLFQPLPWRMSVSVTYCTHFWTFQNIFSQYKVFFFFIYKCASPWDYGTYHIGDQWRLRWACAVSPEPSLFAHMKYERRRRVRRKNRHLAPQTLAHARLKNEFREDETYHNLMSWLKLKFQFPSIYMPNPMISRLPAQWG